MQPSRSVDLERLCSLLQAGAGRAAEALEAVLGLPVRSGAPCVRRRGASPRSSPSAATRVWFEIHGEPGGRFAVCFPEPGRGSLLAALLADPEARAEHGESALNEVGNVLVSHVLSAVAEAYGGRLLPSVPLGREPDPAPALLLESELLDASGTLRGLLVWAPET